MKKYTKIWLISFMITIMTLVMFIVIFVMFSNAGQSQTASVTDTNQTKQTDHTEDNAVPDINEYVSYEDNVGAVSFTEDQVTELARKIFSLDGYLNGVEVKLSNDGTVTVSAKIKDGEKLVADYPDLQKYSMLMGMIGGQKLTVTGHLYNEEGRAHFKIDTVLVAGISVDKGLFTPFIEEDDFSKLFDTDYDTVTVTDKALIFSGELPEILQY